MHSLCEAAQRYWTILLNAFSFYPVSGLHRSATEVPFLEALGHWARRAMCPLYVAGLIGPGERKSIQSMAERMGLPSHGALHHFIASGIWDKKQLEAALAVKPASVSGRAGRVLRKRRHSPAQQGSRLGRRCTTVRQDAGQERQLPDVGPADPGPRRGAGSDRSARFKQRFRPFYRAGPAIRPGSTRPGCRSPDGHRAPNQISPRPSWTGSWRRGRGSAPCWPMRAQGSVPPSVRA